MNGMTYVIKREAVREQLALLHRLYFLVCWKYKSACMMYPPCNFCYHVFHIIPATTSGAYPSLEKMEHQTRIFIRTRKQKWLIIPVNLLRYSLHMNALSPITMLFHLKFRIQSELHSGSYFVLQARIIIIHRPIYLWQVHTIGIPIHYWKYRR